MKDNDWKKRLNILYSTNPDFPYEYDKEPETETLAPEQQNLRVQIEKKGRNGKTATVVNGFIGREEDLKSLARYIKNRCGVGGSAKDKQIIIQGNLKEKVLSILKEAGYINCK